VRELFLKAHQMTREIKRQYQEVDYRAQFGLCLSYLLKNRKEEKEMTIGEGNMRRLVIADWWLRKNPAQETLINEFNNIEVEKETEKAYLLNDTSRQNKGVWVPKSVCKWEEVTAEEIAKAKAQKIMASFESYRDGRKYRKRADELLAEEGESHLKYGSVNPLYWDKLVIALREDGYEL